MDAEAQQTDHKPHYRTLDDTRLTADEMDEQRKRNIAYEYLCHLEEAKIWIQACINEDLPPTTELEEGLRNGVFLAKLGHFFAPNAAPLKKIYDKDQSRYTSRGLHFRHTDNVNHWLRAMEEIGLPSIFYPETTDIYDRKNIPRAVYCVHALSLFLFKLGLAPQIQDLYGKIVFTEEEISAMRKELDKYGIQMPAFSKIGGILANELSVDDAALHAAIIAINEAVDQQNATDTFTKMQNPSAMLLNIDDSYSQQYQDVLYNAKYVKAENAKNKSADLDKSVEQDAYDVLLTQAEIQGNVNKVNTSEALISLNGALAGDDKEALLALLKSSALGLNKVKDENIDFYFDKLKQSLQDKKEKEGDEKASLSKEEIQAAVDQANLEADFEYQIDVLKRKWALLRDYYRSRKRIMPTSKSGRSAGRKKKRPPFKSMSFPNLLEESAPAGSNLKEAMSVERVPVWSHSCSDDTLDVTTVNEMALFPQDPFKSPESPRFRSRRGCRRPSWESDFDMWFLQDHQEPEEDEDVHGHLNFWKGLQPMLNQLDLLEAMKFKHEVHGLLIQYLERSKGKTDIPQENPSHYFSYPMAWSPTSPSSGYSSNSNYHYYKLEKVGNRPSRQHNYPSSQESQTILNVNKAIETEDEALLVKSLHNPLARLNQVEQNANHLYLEEFSSMRKDKGEDLNYDEINSALKVLFAVVAINKAIEKGHPPATFQELTNPEVHLVDLDESNTDKYQDSLATQKSNKADQSNDLLTHAEITTCVSSVHAQVQEEHERILAITAINEAIDAGDENETVKALQIPAAKLNDVQVEQALHYQVLLAKQKDVKADETNEEAPVLWLEEVQACVDKANNNCQEGFKLSSSVADVNRALKEDGQEKEVLLKALTAPNLNIHSVTGKCIEGYQEVLTKAMEESSQEGETGSGWMMNRLKDGTKFFFNINSKEHAWSRGNSISKDFSLLTREAIQKGVSEVTAAHDREVLLKSNEGLITKIQANVRGHLARKAYKERVNFMKTQLPAILKIQAFWRGLRQRRKYNDRLNYLKNNTDSVILLQSYVRMWKARALYKDRLKFFKDHEDAVVKIQAFFRSNLARQDYKALTMDENPSLAVVRKFVHLLDASDNDYAEELELQKLRQQVVAEIRSNQQLEQDLDQMDIKIGLLIKNRITLQDVVTHNKKLTKHTRDGVHRRGLKALSKENHERLEAYQHLFYLLQTCPNYLAKLIFEMPQSKTTKFMESVIYSLFNYGANQREEYLLTRLFQTALEEEINSKVDKMTDIVTGNPLVVKMIVGFNRNQRGQNSLKEMLNPLIMQVIEDRNMRINTNPVEVYKAWVNQTESSTGKASGLPYDVSTEQALQHEEVKTQIEETIQRLQKITDLFLNKILSSLDSIPYGMRYMAKVMYECLEKKFPDSQEKDILKIVGNLLYYRYINSAIVAPDAFDIVNVGAEKALTSDQRRNLGSIAKILQFAASNKGFGGESSYLASMNDYIRNAHEKFKKYCLAACDVEEPEVKFNVNQYSDVTMIAKPIVYISVSEIVDTHQLLMQHQEVIAQDHHDPLHELLEDLGEAPTIDELLGTELTGDEAANDALRTEMSKTEISLTLSSKFEVHTDDKADMTTLLIKTKRMVVDVIACQSGDNLVVVLDSPCNQSQEEMHQAMVKKRDLIDKKMATKNEGRKLVRHASILGDTRPDSEPCHSQTGDPVAPCRKRLHKRNTERAEKLPIEVMKKKVKSNLQTLELVGMVSKQDKYQSLLNSIVQDIRNQRRYRNNRKQELMRLRATIKSLSEKRFFYESQIDYYNQYVKTCLDNLQHKTKKNKKAGLFRKDGQKTQGSVTYSAARLHEKGVVLEIENLPTNQFKNVMFEIHSTEMPGVFAVSAKFMGVSMDKVELVFQDLLQLQYEGVAVMKMFNRAKINVNLLIFLLNRKFYGKQLLK